MGRDGWFFFSDAGSRKSMQRLPLFSDPQLQAWASSLQERQIAYRNVGTKLWLVLPPDKHSIYGHMLANGLIGPGSGRLSQLAAYLREHTTVQVMDFSRALRAASSNKPVFFRRDTHWNTLGQAIAYQTLMASIQEAYPSIRPRTLDELVVTDIAQPGGDLAFMSGLAGLDPDVAPFVQWPTDTLARPKQGGSPGSVPQQALGQSALELVAPRGELSHLFMFGDSFGESLITVIGQHFENTNFWRGREFDDAAVAAAQPEVVIYEMVERYLYDLPPPRPYQIPEPLFYAAGFFAPESGDVGMYRWMGRKGELKVQPRDVPMQLSLDLEGGLFEVSVDGQVLGQIDALQKRAHSSFKLLPLAHDAEVRWRTVHITAISPLRRPAPSATAAADAVDARDVSGRIFDVRWQQVSL